MKVYFINLDRSRDRLSWFCGQGEKLGLQIERVAAVDAWQLSKEELSRLRDLSSGNNSLSAGEIACFLSHRHCWQRILDCGDEWAFVAEDDIHFCANAADFLGTSAWIPRGADVVKAETNLKVNEFSFAIAGEAHGHVMRRLKSYHFGSGGYFVSRGAARDLLDYTEKHCEPVDAILFSPRDGMLEHLNVLQLMPAICLQDVYFANATLESLIVPERVRFHETSPLSVKARGIRKLSRELRRILRQGTNAARSVYAKLARRSLFQKVAFKPGPPVNIDSDVS